MDNKFSDVFKLSEEKDKDQYEYRIYMVVNDNENLTEPIYMYSQKSYKGDSRFRLVPSGRNKGDGSFSLPSVYTKLNRVYPLVDLNIEKSKEFEEYTPEEQGFISRFYEKVLLRDDFKESDSFKANLGSLTKHTFGPKNSYYDIDSISSGEDNLGSFISTMISFIRIYNKINHEGKKRLTGIWCIDEFETSLHPVAQINLFNYILDWSIYFGLVKKI